MKIFIIIILAFIIMFFISSCETGYVKRGHNWVWVTNDENFGSRDHWIDGIDMESFKVLKQNKNFATDKYSAYFRGRKISHATSDGFVPLTDNAYGYAKDNYRVFFDNEVILKADPKTFEVLEFPYSRDKNDVYNGTLPMNLEKNDVEEFKVTNEDKLMKGSKTTTLLSEFLKFSPEYQWIEDLDIEVKWVVTGRWGTGETKTKKFKGLEEIK
ncbi:MAG: DKNYY domain-containing protein [Saprospiraceae bacterium]|nr:DKNYY domain-containing protein [Saprospiraceae bacterium]